MTIATIGYVDVHAHLTHEHFLNDLPEVIRRAENNGLSQIIVNGLHPQSNRKILELAKTYPIVKAALGIYPIEAVNAILETSKLPFAVERFDVDSEIAFIRTQAKFGNLTAIGECGLDAYWLGQETFKDQERVFCQLIEVAKEFSLPLIIHTRKLEQRSIAILTEQKAEKVDFHCFGGKPKHAIAAAEKFGWYFSIPANARKSESFTKMLSSLPIENILTETDCPYLAPIKGERSEPSDVVGTVAYLAELRQITPAAAQELVWNNFQRLFINK